MLIVREGDWMPVNKRIIIIDLEMGNMGSIRSAFEREGCEVHVLKSPPSKSDTNKYTHCVLPGVGSFNQGSKNLLKKGWKKWFNECWRFLDKPFMGICLGMQLMAERGCEGVKENTYVEGLSIVKGSVELMKAEELGESLPHIGWNTVEFIDNNENNLANGDFYFVHSYSITGVPDKNILGKVTYGEEVIAAIVQGKFIGYQFHPEKSQKNGELLIRKFVSH